MQRGRRRMVDIGINLQLACTQTLFEVPRHITATPFDESSEKYQDMTLATTPHSQPSYREKLLEKLFCCRNTQQDSLCAQSAAHTTPVAHNRPLYYMDRFDPNEIDEVDSVC